MKVDIKVPSAGESVTEAIVAEIMAENGSYIEKDGELLELETDKVNQVLVSPDSGVVHINVKVDDVVKPEQVIGYIDTSAANENGSGAKPKDSDNKKEVKSGSAESASKGDSSTSSSSKVSSGKSPSTGSSIEKTSSPSSSQSLSDSQSKSGEDKSKSFAKDGPDARHFAPSYLSTLRKEEKSIVDETPKSGGKPKRANPNQTRKRMSGLRKTIAKRLVEVKNETAMLTTFNEVDMTEIMKIRSKEKDDFLKKHDVKLGFMSFFIKACVSGLKALPDVAAFIDGDAIVYNDTIDIGVSVSTDRGLMVPVVRNCQDLTFAGVEAAIGDYAKKARSGKIGIDDLQGGCFTITNGGVFGSMLSTPILNPPQSAILGMHNIVKRAVVIDDEIVIRPMMYLALSYDHRVIDGKEAVQFLVKVKENLEDPARIMLDF